MANGHTHHGKFGLNMAVGQSKDVFSELQGRCPRLHSVAAPQLDSPLCFTILRSAGDSFSPLAIRGLPLFRALLLLRSIRFFVVIHGNVFGSGELHELLYVGKRDPRIFCGVLIQIGIKRLFGHG